MLSHPSFLSFPYEIRHIIYRYYVHENDGYHFDYESGKLRASNRPVDLAFMYTCTSVAAEMHGLALKTNTVTFSTVYSEPERIRAGRFHRLMKEMADAKARALLTHPEMEIFKTPEVVANVSQHYPRLRLSLNMPYTWMHFHDDIAASTHRKFHHYALELLSQHPGFIEAAADFAPPRHKAFVRSPIFFSNPDPWRIVSEDEVAEIEKVLFIPKPDANSREDADFWKRLKWRFSAATAAIHFLSSISLSTRLEIRNILLREDYESVAHPECHALGLIPFCLENPRLHIERRVSLWRNILPAFALKSLYKVVYPDNNPNGRDPNTFHGNTVSLAFMAWITEALSLPAAGMPPNSFSLVFDGDPSPDRSSEIFERIKQDAAFIEATYLWLLQNKTTLDVPLMEPETFPQDVKDMVENRSIIRCNFPLGSVIDGGKLLDCNPGLTYGQWLEKNFKWCSKQRFKTVPPLPTWADLRREQVLPEEYLESV